MVAERHTIKVVCIDHPNQRSTIVTRFGLVKRPVDCRDAVLRTYGEQTLEYVIAHEARSEDFVINCAEDLPKDRQRSLEWCAECANTTWRASQLGTEMLLGDRPVKRRSVVGSGNRAPDAELHKRVRYRYPLVCWCGLKLDLRHETAEMLFSELADAGQSRITLAALAARIASK